MLERLRFISAGESHGPYLTALLEGMPSGLSLCPEGIDRELARRQKGFGSGGRMRIERDRVELSAGWMGGRTTGGPIALRVANRDWANWAQRDIDPMTIPRPGHVDLVAALKYDYRDLRPGLERASARETTMRVAAGAVCRQLLESFGVRLGGYVRRIGGVELALDEDASSEQLEARASKALDNDLCCPNEEGLEPLRAEVKAAMKARDTLGGVFEVFALGLPPGLGS